MYKFFLKNVQALVKQPFYFLTLQLLLDNIFMWILG